MNETQTLWEVPKGKFDSAMLKLADHIGVEFGGVIESINTDKEACKLTAERLARPQDAFVRQLVTHVCYKFPPLYRAIDSASTLEELEIEFAWNSSEQNQFNDKVVRRALTLAQMEQPGIIQPRFTSRHWKGFSEFVMWVLDTPDSICAGMFLIRSLVFELGLQRLVRSYRDSYQIDLHRDGARKLISPDVPQEKRKANLEQYFRHESLEKLLWKAYLIVPHTPPEEHVINSIWVCG